MPLPVGHVLLASTLSPEQNTRLRTLLEADGFGMVCVQTSSQALEAASSRPFTLALVDVSRADLCRVTRCRLLGSLPGVPVPVILRLNGNNATEAREAL